MNFYACAWLKYVPVLILIFHTNLLADQFDSVPPLASVRAETSDSTIDQNTTLSILSTETPILKRSDRRGYYVKIEGIIASAAGSLVYVDPSGQPWRKGNFVDEKLKAQKKESKIVSRTFNINVNLVGQETVASFVFISSAGTVMEWPFTVSWNPLLNYRKTGKAKRAILKASPKRVNHPTTLRELAKPPKESSKKLDTLSDVKEIFYDGYRLVFKTKSSEIGLFRWMTSRFSIRKISNARLLVMWVGRGSPSNFYVNSVSHKVGPNKREKKRKGKITLDKKNKKNFALIHSVGEGWTEIILKKLPGSKLHTLYVSVSKESSPKMASNHVYGPSLGTTYMIYREGSNPTFTMLALTLMGEYSYSIVPKRWNVGGNFSVTAIPIVHSRTNIGPAVRFFDLNIQGGYVVPGVSEPWFFRLVGGVYFDTSFGTADFGYRGLLGPSVYPVLSRQLNKNQSAYIFLKYSPVKNAESLFTFANSEFSAGGGWIALLQGTAKRLKISVKYSNLKFDLGATQSLARSYTIGAGLLL